MTPDTPCYVQLKYGAKDEDGNYPRFKGHYHGDVYRDGVCYRYVTVRINGTKREKWYEAEDVELTERKKQA